jgi:hypothetical protein
MARCGMLRYLDMHGYISSFLGGHEIYNEEISFSLSHTKLKLSSFLQASTTIYSNTQLISIVAMRLLFLLLFCTQLFVSVSASNPHADVSSRRDNMSRFTVSPVDSSNITEIGNKRKSMFGEERFEISNRQDEIIFWFFTNLSKNVVAGIIREFQAVPQINHQDLAPRAETVTTEISSYTAQPRGDTDQEKTAEFLKSKTQPDTLMVTLGQEDGRIMAWYNVVLTQKSKEEVEKHDGIEKLIPLPSMASDTVSTANDRTQSESKRSEIVARDTQLYDAMAKEGSGVKKIEEFLKTKVKNPDQIMQNDWDGHVTGWYDLELDTEAKKAVEEHEGIENVDIMKEAQWFRALPKNDWSSYSPGIMHNLLGHDDVMLKRSGEWEKQEKADKALIMDSQYK